MSKGPQASVFKNNRATFKLPNGGLSKAAVTAPNQPDVALDYFVDNNRRLVFALAYSDLPGSAGLATVSADNAIRRSHLEIVRHAR